MEKMQNRKRGQKIFGSSKEESEILEYIRFQRSLVNGKPRMTFPEIAKMLNAQGMFPRRAKQWSKVLLFLIFQKAMKNEKYANDCDFILEDAMSHSGKGNEDITE